MNTPAAPYGIAFSLGLLFVDLLEIWKGEPRRIPFFFKCFLSIGIGFSLCSVITFSSFVLLNKLSLPYIYTCALTLFLALLGLWIFKTRQHLPCGARFSWPRLNIQAAKKNLLLLGAMLLAGIPIQFYAELFPWGGWDAWSVWNLKAKFLFLGETHWQNMFQPLLWRSSPHYPLLLPSFTVWAWSFAGQPAQAMAQWTAGLWTWALVGVLAAGLFHLTKKIIPALIAGALAVTLPFFLTLGASQYSDVVVGYFILTAVLNILLCVTQNNPTYAILAGCNAGFLSFSKNEGTLAALLLLVLGSGYLYQNTAPKGSLRENRSLRYFLLAGLLSSLPAGVFQILYAPENLTFINGWQSTQAPANFARLKIVLVFFWLELISHKWQGLWILIAGGILISKRAGLTKQLWIIPAFLTGYLFLTIFYYVTNTYFEITWWLSVTLNRVLFTLLPTILAFTILALEAKEHAPPENP